MPDLNEAFEREKQKEKDHEFERDVAKQNEWPKPICGICGSRHSKERFCFDQPFDCGSGV
jgi:hypothetical protein